MAFHCLRHFTWETQETQLLMVFLDCHRVYQNLLQSVCFVDYELLRLLEVHLFSSFYFPCVPRSGSFASNVSQFLNLWTSKSFQWEQQIWAVSDTLVLLSFHGPLGVHQPGWKLLTCSYRVLVDSIQAWDCMNCKDFCHDYEQASELFWFSLKSAAVWRVDLSSLLFVQHHERCNWPFVNLQLNTS